MSSILIEAIQTELGATERWPDDVRLYQPYPNEQIVFPDYASCLSVKTFLHMCGLKFGVELRTNAEEMSPSGKVPFVKIGPFLVSEIEPIIAFINTRGFQLNQDLTDTQRSEMKAYMSLVESVLVNSELHLAWLNPEVVNEVTKMRYGSVYAWPLDKILPWKKQREVRSRLDSVGWAKKSIDEVCDEISTCCQALSERLDKQQYFFGDRPTELDAIVFGHLYTILTTSLPISRFAEVIREFKNLTDFCQRIDQKYFKDRQNDY
ncbi:hypothetical protein ScPMuIL_013448 [Solemya velum]